MLRSNQEKRINKPTMILLFGLIVIFAFFNSSRLGISNKQISGTNQQAEIKNQQFLSIPKLNIWAPIVEVSSDDEAMIQTALINGLVHYPQTAAIGDAGNAYIVGHSSNYTWIVSKYNDIFKFLPQIAPEDDIFVIDQFGQMDFKVIATLIVDSSDLSVLSQATGGRVRLSLQTSYPIGTAERRFIVVAEMLKK